MQKTEISIEVLKNLALMQYEGNDFFILDGTAYEGSEGAKLAEYVSEKDEDQTFKEWVIDNCTEVEEYDENGNYMVLTDEEADEKWDEYLDSYIDECLDIPKEIRYYFDEEKWKSDARMDGRGHSLSSYDGNENEETVEGETFYIYRTN